MAETRRNRDRIAARARGLFAGRRAEVARLRELVVDGDEPVVVLVHGTGGIGKTHLVHAALDTRMGLPPRWIDCRAIEPTPAGLRAAVAGRRDGRPDAVAVADEIAHQTLVLDGYEHFGLMDAWIRRELVPATIPGSTLVAVGRDRPSAAWFATPGLTGLVERLEVGPLDEDDARAMLHLRGVEGDDADRLLRFARGNALALELGALALRERPGAALPDDPPPALLGDLVAAFLAGLDGRTVDAVEAAAVVRRVTEPLLAELLGGDARDDFARLRALPFAQDAGGGLTLQEAVREVVAGDLARRDPARLRALRRTAAAAAVRTIEAAAAPSWAATADALFLATDPIVRDAFFPPGAIVRACEPAGPADRDAVDALVAAAAPPEEAQVLARWAARLRTRSRWSAGPTAPGWRPSSSWRSSTRSTRGSSPPTPSPRR
jgi:hypothetical protein